MEYEYYGAGVGRGMNLMDVVNDIQMVQDKIDTYEALKMKFPHIELNMITFAECFILLIQHETFFFDALKEWMQYLIQLGLSLEGHKCMIKMALQTIASLLEVAKISHDQRRRDLELNIVGYFGGLRCARWLGFFFFFFLALIL